MTSATAVLEAPESTFAVGVPAFLPAPDKTYPDLPIPSIPIEEEGRQAGEFPSKHIGTRQESDSASAGPNRDVEGNPQRRQPRQHVLKPEITQEARQWLTGDLEVINNRIMLLCIEHARRAHLSIKSLKLSIKRSWEDEFRELALQLFVEGNIPQSLALWESIGDSIQHWGEKQNPACRRRLNAEYAVFVEAVNPL